MPVIRLLIALGLVANAPLALAEAQAAIAVSIEEWTVPWEDTRPRDPTVAADGRIWFVGQSGDYVARLNPESGEFQRFDLARGTGPHNVITGPDGQLYVAGNRNARIIRVDPVTGDQETFRLPGGDGDPHTQQFGPDEDLWFTMQGYNAIGRLNPDRSEFDVIKLPTERARPYGLRIAPSGMVWFTQFGTRKLARLEPGALKVREYQIQRDDARPRRLAIADDGAIWYVDYLGGYLGRLDPPSGEFTEWAAPSGRKALPYGMTMDGEGRLWFVETGVNPNRLVAFDPAVSDYVANEPIPSGGGAVRHMVYDAVRDAIWFGTDANTIGVARIGE